MVYCSVCIALALINLTGFIFEVLQTKSKEEAKKHLSEINKGKIIPQETLDKIAATIKNRQMSNQKVNSQCRSVHTPEGIFHNFALIVEHFGINKNTIIRRCKNKNPKYAEWYYIDED